jgi:hypothetical protein
MAKSFDINTSSYDGELALPYIAPAILAAETIATGAVTIHQNVKYKAVLKKLSNNAEIVKANDCSFTGVAGDLDLDEVVLQVTELMVNQELCKKDFRADWEALQTGRGLLNDRIPPNFETFLLQFLGRKVAENIEKSIWGGNFDPTDSSLTGGGEITTSFDGLYHHIVDGAASLGNDDQVANAIDSTNVLARLDGVVNGAPATVQNDSRAVIYMSRKTGFLLQRALGGFVDRVVASEGSAAQGIASPEFLTSGLTSQYMGIPIVMLPGCPNDTMLYTNPENLHFGCDLTTDQTNARVVDMSLTDGSDNVRVAMRFSGGTQIASLADISVCRRTS